MATPSAALRQPSQYTSRRTGQVYGAGSSPTATAGGGVSPSGPPRTTPVTYNPSVQTPGPTAPDQPTPEGAGIGTSAGFTTSAAIARALATGSTAGPGAAPIEGLGGLGGGQIAEPGAQPSAPIEGLMGALGGDAGPAGPPGEVPGLGIAAGLLRPGLGQRMPPYLQALTGGLKY
mgnify:CR=1 FL=1